MRRKAETGKKESGVIIKIIETIEMMQTKANELREKGKRIAFVPTMGYLHEGHLSLIREARKHGDRVVVSIFVNPAQFGPGEDLSTYPRSFEKDVEHSEEAGADYVFAPKEAELYGENYQTYVRLEKLPGHLCGISRPVHFRGVATIVTKLFNIVKPHAAVFGNKDYQQVLVIRQMVADLNFDIEIIGAPIVRESDGLAMSSRNSYLNSGQRLQARCLNKALKKAQKQVEEGETDAITIIQSATDLISDEPEAQIDYIEICDPDTLEPVSEITGPCLMALAVKIGTPRLIDNAILTPGIE